MRRQDREMTREFALMVVDKCEYSTLATVNADGTPYIVPLSFARVDEYIYFHCAKVGHKLDNLRHCPKVCMNFVTGTNVLPEQITTEYESATVFGTADEVTDTDTKMLGMRAIMQKYSAVIMHKFEQLMQTAGTSERMAVWRVHIESISGKCNDKTGKHAAHKMHP